MKTLFVLRHAKSSWSDPDLSDHDRPLNKRGRRDAPKLARWASGRGVRPDVVVSSTARRARDTALAFVDEIDTRSELWLTSKLYLAEPFEIVSLLREVQGESVMIVGHNPGLESFVVAITGERVRLPTSALAWIDLPISDWSELDLEARGGLRELWLPREVLR
jgi:phosphohistidine phosphatase